ncbi:hypothetical protein O181_003877 [Austropuccinia psidii MF-1]|uniref:RNA helicase n=1 Tax=Austropuccinia psidii MF-1 TaxID=1389203 RepID=A0A9Q3BFN9_9BASI|nr:hypothetical protein [Austropuccinia psidii MF-1]
MSTSCQVMEKEESIKLNLADFESSQADGDQATSIEVKKKKKKKRKQVDLENAEASVIGPEGSHASEKPKKKRNKSDQPNQSAILPSSGEPHSNNLAKQIKATDHVEISTEKLEKKRKNKDKKKRKQNQDPASGPQTQSSLQPLSSDAPNHAQSSNCKDLQSSHSSIPTHPPLSNSKAQDCETKAETVGLPDTKAKDRKKEKKEKRKKASNASSKSHQAGENLNEIDSSKPLSQLASSADVKQFILSNKLTYEPPEIENQFPPVLDFEAVQVHDSLRKAFLTFQKPSPIQSAVWPVLLVGRDVVGIAETGSGKTLAFGIPALQHILTNSKTDSSSINVLVIAPTRELAMQTESTLSDLGKLLSPPVKTLCVYGGVEKSVQQKALARGAGVRVVAGTPGRILDLANEGNLKLDKVSWLVLDEADRMLDKGFENDIRAIIGLCLPSRSQNDSQARLTAMFSATWPTSVRRLAADFMCDPVRILVGEDELTASNNVQQSVEVLETSRGKEWKLLSTLQGVSKGQSTSSKGSQLDKIIVFALYKKEAQRLHQFLLQKGYRSCCIEGDMSQDKRTQSLADFKSGKASILVATDVAARGLDIPKVEVVINVTFPLTIEDYIHRIGRTGRAGRPGKSITFFTEDDKSHAGELMRVLKDADQAVPEALTQWGGQIKKKTHAAYGNHWKDIDPTVKAQKIKFN